MLSLITFLEYPTTLSKSKKTINKEIICICSSSSLKTFVFFILFKLRLSRLIVCGFLYTKNIEGSFSKILFVMQCCFRKKKKKWSERFYKLDNFPLNNPIIDATIHLILVHNIHRGVSLSQIDHQNSKIKRVVVYLYGVYVEYDMI